MTTITALPTAPSRSTDDAATFSSKADTFVAALQTFRTETNAVATETNAASAAATAASAAATSVSGATAWAGTTVSYTLGNAVWSGINFKTYRLSIASKAANVANTDPSVDTASWTLVNGTGDVIMTSAQTLTNKTLTNPVINGFTGSTSVVNIGSGQVYKSAAGDVGIGTASPAARFNVESPNSLVGLFRNTSSTAYTSLRIYNNQNIAGRALEIDYAGSAYASALLTGGPTGESASISTTGSYPLVLGTNGNARLTITAGGDLGIWTNSPLSKLSVAQSADGFDQGITVSRTGANRGTLFLNASNDTLNFGRSTATSMSLDANGNLGLGYTTGLPAASTGGSASAGLFSARSQLVGHQTSMGILQFASASNLTQIRSYGVTTGTGQIAFQVGGGGGSADFEAARINSSGYSKFSNDGTYLNGSGTNHEFRQSAADIIAYFSNKNAISPFGIEIDFTALDPNNTGNSFLSAYGITTLRAQIRSNGGLANFSANNVNLSDVRTKTDIQPATSYLDKICAIPVKTFLYKDQTDTERNLGVIAQDVDAVAPELIDRGGFGETPEGESPYLAIYQTDLQYALMKCIQEQQALITSLTARVAALEA